MKENNARYQVIPTDKDDVFAIIKTVDGETKTIYKGPIKSISEGQKTLTGSVWFKMECFFQSNAREILVMRIGILTAQLTSLLFWIRHHQAGWKIASLVAFWVFLLTEIPEIVSWIGMKLLVQKVSRQTSESGEIDEIIEWRNKLMEDIESDEHSEEEE